MSRGWKKQCYFSFFFFFYFTATNSPNVQTQPTAVPPDTLPEPCTMTMHNEISARGSLMRAGDGSAMFFDTLSSTRQWGREKSAPTRTIWDRSLSLAPQFHLTDLNWDSAVYIYDNAVFLSSMWYVLRFEHGLNRYNDWNTFNTITRSLRMRAFTRWIWRSRVRIRDICMEFGRPLVTTQ